MRILSFLLMLFPIFAYGQNDYLVKAEKNDIENSADTLSKEQIFVKDNFPYIDMADWDSTIRFMAPKSSYKFSVIDLKPYKGKSGLPFSDNILQSDYSGKIFTVVEIEERLIDCPKGKCTRVYVILESENEKFEYSFFGDKEELKTSRNFNNISGLVYLNDIDKARELLLGKTIYVLSNQWMQEREDGTGGVYVYKEKFVPVLITKIGLGTSDGPVKIVFKVNDGNEYFMNTTFSGINAKSPPTFGKYFYDFFSFDNPKSKHPNISAGDWALIQKGQVRIGMSKDTCKLSWGEPNEINKTIGSFGVKEQWVYGSGSYLYMENGRLTAIQN